VFQGEDPADYAWTYQQGQMVPAHRQRYCGESRREQAWRGTGGGHDTGAA